MDLTVVLIILMSTVLIDNYVLSRCLGICPFLGVSKKLNQSVGMGLAVTAVLILATLATWPIQNFLLNPFELEYMQTIVFILVIAALVQMLEIILKKFSPSLHKGLGVYLPLITTNCVVLELTIVNVSKNIPVIDQPYSFLYAIVNAIGCGLGFLLAMVLFSGLRSRMDETKMPKPFRGIAATLIAASFISLAFMGLGGIVETLFTVA